MFIDNKYTKIYFRLVNRAKSRVLVERGEKHHIVPKSFGGSNQDDNLVKLTFREHFICHRLLTKMTTGRQKHQMEKAAYCMMFFRKDKLLFKGSRTFEFLKIRYAIAHSALTKGLIKRSDETKQRCREAALRRPKRIDKRKPLSEAQRKILDRTGKEMTEATKLKIAKSNTGKKRTQEAKDRISRGNIGKHYRTASEDTKKKISAVLKGRPSPRRGMEPWNKGVSHSPESIAKMARSHANRPMVTCPHCQKTMQKPNFAAWHGDKCKNAKTLHQPHENVMVA